ncbi:MAG: hypothetical protein IKF90_06905 [Parasporobacterium sp.]|nr:hypothetical protein [Parasporobacterium sp.]
MKNKKNLILIIIIAILVIAVVILAIFLFKPKSKPKEAGTGVTGQISEGWDTGIDNGSVDAGSIQIPGYKDAKMQAGDTTLHLSIGNPEVNEVGLYATVELEDGTVLYESELLEPGYGIKDIPLTKSLDQGTYNAFVVYQIVTLDEAHTPMNSARAAFTLYVE